MLVLIIRFSDTFYLVQEHFFLFRLQALAVESPPKTPYEVISGVLT